MQICRKSILSHIIAFFCFLMSIIGLHAQAGTTPSIQSSQLTPLRLIMCFEEGTESSEELFLAACAVPGPATRTLADAIEQDIPALVSTPILFYATLAEQEVPPQPYQFIDQPLQKWQKYSKILKNDRIKWQDRKILDRLTNPNQWDIYESEGKDFVLILPHNYAYKSAFNLNSFKQIPPDMLRKTFSQEEYIKKPVKIRNLDKFFNKNEPLTPKNIYLVGHGAPGISIAGIPIKKYKKLLKMLENINTRFLFVSSCYSGGENLIKAHQNITTNQSFTNFAIAINATEDAPSTFTHKPPEHTGEWLKDFFERLEHWQKGIKGSYYFEADITINDVLLPIYERTPGRENLPSVRLGGKNKYFRSIELPITYNLTIDNLQNLLKERDKSPILLIDSEKIKTILVYPAIIHDMPIVIQGNKCPYFASKIPGNGLHFIDTIIAPDIELETLLLKGFLRLPSGGSTSRVGWFIKTCLCKNTRIKGIPDGALVLYGLCVGRGPSSETFEGINEILCRYDQAYVGRAELGSFLKIIDSFWQLTWYQSGTSGIDMYKERANLWLDLCMPTEEALKEATGGQETLEKLRSTKDDFIKDATSGKLNPVINFVASNYITSDVVTLKKAALTCCLELLSFGKHQDFPALIDQAINIVMTEKMYGQFLATNLGMALVDNNLQLLFTLLEKAIKENHSMQMLYNLAKPLLGLTHLSSVDRSTIEKINGLLQHVVNHALETITSSLDVDECLAASLFIAACIEYGFFASPIQSDKTFAILEQKFPILAKKSIEGFAAIAYSLALKGESKLAVKMVFTRYEWPNGKTAFLLTNTSGFGQYGPYVFTALQIIAATLSHVKEQKDIDIHLRSFKEAIVQYKQGIEHEGFPKDFTYAQFIDKWLK